MRLIDADTLMEVYGDKLVTYAERYSVEGGFLARAMNLLKTQPTIERPTSEWIKMSDADGYYYCCNNCGEELPRYFEEQPTYEYPFPEKKSIEPTRYCPHCGVRMVTE